MERKRQLDSSIVFAEAKSSHDHSCLRGCKGFGHSARWEALAGCTRGQKDDERWMICKPTTDMCVASFLDVMPDSTKQQQLNNENNNNTDPYWINQMNLCKFEPYQNLWTFNLWMIPQGLGPCVVQSPPWIFGGHAERWTVWPTWRCEKIAKQNKIVLFFVCSFVCMVACSFVFADLSCLIFFIFSIISLHSEPGLLKVGTGGRRSSKPKKRESNAAAQWAKVQNMCFQSFERLEEQFFNRFAKYPVVEQPWKVCYNLLVTSSSKFRLLKLFLEPINCCFCWRNSCSWEAKKARSDSTEGRKKNGNAGKRLGVERIKKYTRSIRIYDVLGKRHVKDT